MDHQYIQVSSLNKTITSMIPASKIQLNYDRLSGRPKVCMAKISDGTIWAAVGFNTGTQIAHGLFAKEMIFHSNDDNNTWDGRIIEPTGKNRICGFTVLNNDKFLLTLATNPDSFQRLN